MQNTHTEKQARALDVRHCAQAGQPLTGQLRLDALPRLHDSLEPGIALDAPDWFLHWHGRAWLETPLGGQEQLWMGLTLHGVLPLACQRCLGLLTWPVSVELRYRFVDNEAQAESEDEWAEEDVLVEMPALDLVALIEDEVVMAMPLVPRHETCPGSGGVAPTVDTPAPSQRPFAHALAGLRPKPRPEDE